MASHARLIGFAQDPAARLQREAPAAHRRYFYTVIGIGGFVGHAAVQRGGTAPRAVSGRVVGKQLEGAEATGKARRIGEWHEGHMGDASDRN